ncbi:helix-turn-helix transcriptional regulator [Paracoccus sp. Z330]|uniref:Helix-turn-helix transcriptional regulator n=1 Tax=Paracoccus onchidii TaxID=3017813 RepID=A0ABT4ZF11_9RHOB|nr:helix-turn-helix transcriptional regulator [Paracoccus onchidii]MDB6177918.1 helix-turn-helix transcriptional regulator [Paracoccus onchidii]
MMTLSQHLESTGETQSAFAARVGVQQGTISKLVRQQITPSFKLAQKIEAATSGNVAVSSWVLSFTTNSEFSHVKSQDNDAA